jgi:hypothetical protein
MLCSILRDGIYQRKLREKQMKDYWLAEMLEEMEKKLAPAEQEFSNALIAIAKKYGKLSNDDSNGIWVGYVEAAQNENASIGVMCINCAQYEGSGVCKIVAQTVEDGGYCRLAAIPDGVVKPGRK